MAWPKMAWLVLGPADMAVPRRACVHVLRVMRVALGLHISVGVEPGGQGHHAICSYTGDSQGRFQCPGYFPKEEQAGTKESQGNLKITEGSLCPGPPSRQSQVYKQRLNRSHLLWVSAASSVQGKPAKVPGWPPHLLAADPGPTGPHHLPPAAPIISRALDSADSRDRAHPP